MHATLLEDVKKKNSTLSFYLGKKKILRKNVSLTVAKVYSIYGDLSEATKMMVQ